METRVAAVGIQVIVGFLLAVPFQAELEGLGRDAYVVSILSGMLATVLLLLVVLSLLLKRTKVGLAFRAVSSNL